MIRRSTGAAGPEFKKKNSHGRSFKHIDKPADRDSGGGHEVGAPARRMTKGHKAGTATRDKQNPKEQRARKIEAWCEGKSKGYT